jgi:hypothetical protein
VGERRAAKGSTGEGESLCVRCDVMWCGVELCDVIVRRYISPAPTLNFLHISCSAPNPLPSSSISPLSFSPTLTTPTLPHLHPPSLSSLTPPHLYHPQCLLPTHVLLFPPPAIRHERAHPHGPRLYIPRSADLLPRGDIRDERRTMRSVST